MDFRAGVCGFGLRVQGFHDRFYYPKKGHSQVMPWELLELLNNIPLFPMLTVSRSRRGLMAASGNNQEFFASIELELQQSFSTRIPTSLCHPSVFLGPTILINSQVRRIYEGLTVKWASPGWACCMRKDQAIWVVC